MNLVGNMAANIPTILPMNRQRLAWLKRRSIRLRRHVAFWSTPIPIRRNRPQSWSLGGRNR